MSIVGGATVAHLSEDLARRDVKRGDQRLGPVSHILKLEAAARPATREPRLVNALEHLNPGFSSTQITTALFGGFK
jgi:hypothetical protein